MPTMRSASPSAASISVLEAKIVTMRCGGAGSVTARSNASRTMMGSAAAIEVRLQAHAAVKMPRQDDIRITSVPAVRR
jgi:hypothetical protein